jgi:hypothetical protein
VPRVWALILQKPPDLHILTHYFGVAVRKEIPFHEGLRGGGYLQMGDFARREMPSPTVGKVEDHHHLGEGDRSSISSASTPEAEQHEHDQPQHEEQQQQQKRKGGRKPVSSTIKPHCNGRSIAR